MPVDDILTSNRTAFREAVTHALHELGRCSSTWASRSSTWMSMPLRPLSCCPSSMKLIQATSEARQRPSTRPRATPTPPLAEAPRRGRHPHLRRRSRPLTRLVTWWPPQAEEIPEAARPIRARSGIFQAHPPDDAAGNTSTPTRRRKSSEPHQAARVALESEPGTAGAVHQFRLHP